MALQIARNVDATQPVTTAEMKTYLKTNYGTDANEDALLVDLIFSAKRFLEDRGQFSISSQTWKAWTDNKHDLVKFVIPMPPLITIEKVYRIEDDQTETELTLNTDYFAKGLTNDTLFFFSDSGSVPRGNVLSDRPIRVEYTAGHATVPDDLKIAVMKMTAENYINRSDSTKEAIHIVPTLSMQLIRGYSRRRIF